MSDTKLMYLEAFLKFSGPMSWPDMFVIIINNQFTILVQIYDKGRITHEIFDL